jgi:cobalt-zinc-cadmium efflux system membrane fusion protein
LSFYPITSNNQDINNRFGGLSKIKMKNNIIILLLLAGLLACAEKDKEKPEEAPTEQESNTVEITQAQYQTAGIEIGTTTIRHISDVVVASGVIDIPPQNLVSISAPMGGFVRKTELLQGMNVKKGQVLATIENPEFIQIQQDYLETESRLDYAQLRLKHSKHGWRG